MKLIITIFLLFNVYVQSSGQTSPGFDSVLAKKLHADAYGMKKYILVILKTGTATVTEKAKRDSIFGGHMKNIQRLAAENKLVLAGPLGKNDKAYEGIFVLNTENMKEAEQMLATDPAVNSGLLVSELYSWYASASVQQIPGLHERIQKEHF
jgi:uncharacterized protein YciI